MLTTQFQATVPRTTLHYCSPAINGELVKQSGFHVQHADGITSISYCTGNDESYTQGGFCVQWRLDNTKGGLPEIH